MTDSEAIATLLVDYYDGLRRKDSTLGSFYTADGTMDVDGWTGKGRAAIDAVYEKVWKLPAVAHGVRHYLISNQKILISGDHASVDFLWTEITSPTFHSTPRFEEMGLEHDDLVKADGRWYIHYRHVTGDGGVPDGIRQPGTAGSAG